jgi:signal transduction histidine kinase
LHREVARLKTELSAANAELERSRRLAALGEMAAGIAHEVRNPLGGIRLYAGHLEQDLSDRPSCQETARKIVRAVRGLDAIVNDVLAFAREMPLRREIVDVEELLQRAIDEALPTTDQGQQTRMERGKPICTKLSVEPAGLTMRLDAPLVHRAIVNLVRNAAEAMTEGDRAGGELSVSARVEAGWCAVGVQDTGPGIPHAVMERMFNPFFTTRATGTGLGLSIVHRIVDAHGGRVQVRNRAQDARGGGGSEGSGGAVVELWLPVETANRREQDGVTG